ncbi:metal-dependent hydrolase [Limimaricola pyoseonensis]|uniref:UPF0173 metal-dependent hydrolase SAMN04488567_1577 n=1 Tax=Limimaricola pyoseonensis TaxID=521013 RepID=A0A1G7CNS1_9RHOB|nr:metal-dependent hydrolase [Limimaricola pyoseonensis]SDE40959.1 L-ascorbate metabolism protein UlaG, beta-lactamase superfamily [Limimaricola pyoseonensis]
MKLTWLGHASWRIEVGREVLLIDPWLEGNPAFPDARRIEALTGATRILVTHGHGDHASEVPAIAAEMDLPVICIADLAGWWSQNHGLDCTGINKGGTVDLDGASVTMVNAVHSSSVATSGGQPVYAGAEAGFVIRGEGRCIYFSGDTDVMADMGWIGEYYRPDIGILACGGHFTMDMKAAAWASKRFFDFETVLPSHYASFPVVAATADELVAELDGVDVRVPAVLETVEIAAK